MSDDCLLTLFRGGAPMDHPATLDPAPRPPGGQPMCTSTPVEPAAQDLAEKAARVLWERATGKTWSPAMADEGPSPTLVATAGEWLCIFQAAGLSVAERPSDPVVPVGPLRALAVEWLRKAKQVRDTGGDAAVAGAFEQHGTLLLQFLGETTMATAIS